MTASLPHNREQITDSSGRATVPFRRFLEELSRHSGEIAAISEAQPAAITGSGSVDVDDEGDETSIRLVNDSAAPGAGHFYGTDASGTKGWFERLGAVGCTFDGGGDLLEVGATCDVLIPFDCTIQAATLVADQSGSLVISVWADSFANYPPTSGDNIAAAAPPTLSAAQASRDTTLTGWTATLAAGSVVRFTVNSVTTITRAALTLEVLKA